MEKLEALIDVQGIQKTYKSGFELKPCDLKLFPGDTIAFLGKNGAGKSTFFQIITGNCDATKGKVYLGGERLTPDNYQMKKLIGYLPQNLQLPKWVSCLDILRYGANLYELEHASEKIKQTIAYWDCEFYQNKPLASCSHGMQKRVGLAIATIHNPKCLVLDEPFSGLDIYHTRALEKEIQRRQSEGLTTLLSTHVTPYVAKLCQKVFFIDEGQIKEVDGWNQHSSEQKINIIEQHFFKDQA